MATDVTDCITVTEYARAHNISRGRVHQLIADGRIAAYRMGTQLLVHADAEWERRKPGRPVKQVSQIPGAEPKLNPEG